MHLRSKGFVENKGRSRLQCLLLLLLAIAFGRMPGFATPNPQSSLGEATTWPKVRQPISITNASRDLDFTQFHIFEDGVEQVSAKVIRDTRPASILIMIDVSRSTRDKADLMIQAARKLVASARPEDDFEIVSFSWQTYLEQNFTKDRSKLDDVLSGLKFEGGSTALFNAIDASLKEEEHNTESTKRAIVLISDGMNNTSTLPQKTVIRALKAVGAPTMYVVCTPSPLKAGLETSERLSTASGGKTFAAGRADSLELAAEQIAEDIDGLSSLEYTSTHTKRDGKAHSIEVRHPTLPGAPNINLVFRQEYYAPSK